MGRELLVVAHLLSGKHTRGNYCYCHYARFTFVHLLAKPLGIYLFVNGSFC